MQEMDSREFSVWMAFDRYHEPIGDEWRQTGTLAAAMLAPYCPRGKTPKPDDFMPLVSKSPQHPTQIESTLKELAKILGE